MQNIEDAAADSWLSFSVGEKRFLLAAQEVAGLFFCAEQQLYPLPLPDPRLEGLIALNGNAVPVLRLPALCGSDSDAGAEQVYLVLRAEDASFAFRVDQPLRVQTAEAEDSSQVKLSAAALLAQAMGERL